jgi:hypothetical protein
MDFSSLDTALSAAFLDADVTVCRGETEIDLKASIGPCTVSLNRVTESMAMQEGSATVRIKVSDLSFRPSLGDTVIQGERVFDVSFSEPDQTNFFYLIHATERLNNF